MLYFFRDLGLEPNAQDKKGSTPLHWACYSKSEISASYLLAWKEVDVNIQDARGMTPLHLAVRSVEEVGSCRPVRALLIQGADRNVEDE